MLVRASDSVMGMSDAGFYHRLGAGEVGHVGVARAIDDRLGPNRHQALLGGDHHAGHAVVLDDRIDGADVDQVPAADLVQGVEHGDLQVLDVAPEFVLADPHGLIAVGQELLDQQFVDRRSRLAAGPHLVDRHAQGPGAPRRRRMNGFRPAGSWRPCGPRPAPRRCRPARRRPPARPRCRAPAVETDQFGAGGRHCQAGCRSNCGPQEHSPIQTFFGCGVPHKDPHSIARARFMRYLHWFQSERRLFQALCGDRRILAVACRSSWRRTGRRRCLLPGPGPCSIQCSAWTYGRHGLT